MKFSVRRLLGATILVVGGLLSACSGASEPAITQHEPTPTVAPATATAMPASPTATEDASPTATDEASTATATSASTEALTASPTSTEPAARPTTQPSPTAVDLTGFQSAIDALTTNVEGTVAVSLAASDGTVLYELNPAEPMEAASLYKLGIMVEVYREQAEGLLSFDDSIELTEGYFHEGADSFGLGDIGSYVSIDSLVSIMITQSSNVAAYALLDHVGSENVNATMSSLGLDGIQIRWSPSPYVPEQSDEEDVEESEVEPEGSDEAVDEPVDETVEDESDEPSGSSEPLAGWLAVGAKPIMTVRGESAFNVTQASDLSQLFVLLLSGSVVSEEASHEMLDLLGQQQIYGGLPALLPDGSVAHKTGYLADGVVNDAGVIYTPHGPFVAVVLTEGLSEDVAYNITSQIGLLLFQLES